MMYHPQMGPFRSLIQAHRCWNLSKSQLKLVPYLFSASSSSSSSSNHSTFQDLKSTFDSSKSKWYPIPFGLGLLVLGGVELNRIRKRENTRVDSHRKNGTEPVLIDGPWQVHVISTLPLRSISRLWGWVNSLTLPISLRSPVYSLYSSAFGCKLDEMLDPVLENYENLAAFFYRKLKPDARVLASADLVSPSDGTVLSFGVVTEGRVEQIKGKHYSIEALLGKGHRNHLVGEDTFAKINFIDYSLDEIMGDDHIVSENADTKASGSLLKTQPEEAKGLYQHTHGGHTISPRNALHYCVIYLAPGDYHRFHSPTNWLVEKRRHFVGELFSVSPMMTKILSNLFVLNERVALLGSWKHGLFSMIPVGATNVGSIVINFDEELKTNQPHHDTSVPIGHYSELAYSHASSTRTLPGFSLQKGVEMGGFKLGSSIVLVFEAPTSFSFSIQDGQDVKMGQALGGYRLE